MAWPAAAITAPSRTATAPTGTSPRRAAARASPRARRMNDSSSRVTAARGLPDRDERELPLQLRLLDDAHGVVDEAHALEGDAVDRTVVLADAAVGAAVVVDVDLAFVAARDRVAAGCLADDGVATGRSLAVLAEHHHVDGFLGAHVVARPAEHAHRLVVVVHLVA